MVSQLSKPSKTAEIFYPDCDDQPMASNTEQYQWIVVIQQNLNWLLPNAFVAGDLFWYPIEGRPDISVAPDVMVALGRPKGKRLSYKQWQEDNTPPQVVFEILSPSNTKREMEKKLLFFDRHGVEEYYLYDTETYELSGFLRDEFGLSHIPKMDDWESPLLKIRFDTTDTELQLVRPDGSPFVSYEEVIAQAEQSKQEAASAKQEAASAEARVDKLAEKLRSLGVDPDNL